MTVKWCPNCRRTIAEPPLNPLSSYAMFWRDKCYICDSPLRPLASPPAAPQSSSTPFRDTAATEKARADAAVAEKARADAAAERARADAAAAEKARADAAAERDREVARLRFEYEKRQRTIQALQAKILTLTHDLDQQIRYFDEYMAGPKDGPSLVDQFFGNQRRLRDAIANCESEISEAEREMAKIQQDLDTKRH